MKKLLSIILVAVLLLNSTPLSAFNLTTSVATLNEDVDIDIGEDKDLLGDVDGTNIIDLCDVNALARYLSGWKIYVEYDALDVNEDGAVNLKDLIYLAQYVAGWKTGEIYFHQTDAEHIVANDNDVLYVDNEILLVASNTSKYTDIEKLAKNYNAEIVGWIEQTDDYQLQIKKNHTLDELQGIALSLKESEFVQDAYVNFAFETNENKTEDRNGFIYGDEWEKDLQNFNNCKGRSWGIEAIETLAAWDILDKNQDIVNPVKVGLIDSAFDTNHEDLGFAQTFYNINSDKAEHGTHVAGTMAAKSNNPEGICGVYPYGDGNLYGVSSKGMTSRPENGTFFTSSMYLKIAYSELILRNVKVINTSLGFNYHLWKNPLPNTGPRWDAQVNFLESNANILGDFLNRLIEKGYDFVLVTSAGNDSNRTNGIVYDSKYNSWTTVISEDDYPQVYSRIIVVGSVDSDFEISDFSNGGERVDVYAPGDAIFSTLPNDEYDINSGTSMAAPHVSGVAAMVWSINNHLHGAQVKRIICESSSYRCNSCNMIDASMAVRIAKNVYTSSGDNNIEKGGILSWVVSAKNVNTKVQNASLTLTNVQSGETIDTTSDSFGHFEFFVPAGQYTLSVKADNYENYSTPNGSFITVKNNSIEYYDWIKMEPKYSNKEILGTYKGSYFLDQEEVGLTLSVYNEGARYKAIFEFYNLPGKNNTKNGKYFMDVSYNISTGEYLFEATDWIEKPEGFKTLDLNGKLNGNILSGELIDEDMLSAELPIVFSVTKTQPPFDAFEYNGHHYKLYVEVCDTWEEAKEYCESLGGHLAVISDKEENDALYSYILSCGEKNAYFGYTDNQVEGNWYWTGDNSSYTNWQKKEPNNADKEDYAMFYCSYGDGTWNDGNFGQGTELDARNFICEWDF